MSDFTRGEGGVSAESDMSDFWPDFFLQTAPKLASPLKIFAFFRDFAIAHADTITSPTHRQHQRFTLTGSYVHTLAHEYALAGEFHRFTGSCSC